MTLIPDSELQAARARFEQEQAAKATTPVEIAPTVVKPVAAIANAVTPKPTHGFVETRRAYIRCASCGHWRSMHCTKRKLKPGQSPTHAVWKGFVDGNGQIQPCQHFLDGARPFACNSTACAQVLGEGDAEYYCDCKKFVSPFLKKRPAKAPVAKPRTPSVSRAELARRAAILIEVVREDPTLTVAQLAAAAERPASWIRATLKKAGIAQGRSRKKTSLTAGWGVLPGIEATAESAVKP